MVTFKVFVCSTVADLVVERGAVLGVINGLKVAHGSMEYFGARSARPIETCLDEVRRSDVLVLLLGHRYGSLVEGTTTSFTEAEYNEALRTNKTVLAYIMGDSVRVLPKDVESDAASRTRLAQWKAEVLARHTVGRFEQGQDLASKVEADLRAHLARAGIRVAPPRESNSVLLLESDVTDTLHEALSDLGNKMTDTDDDVTSLIAETNASGFFADDVEILEVGHFLFSEAAIPFRARIQLTGESDEDKVFHGDKIFVDVTGTLTYDGGDWTIDDYDASAKLEDVAGDPDDS